MPQPKKDAVHRYFEYEETNNFSQCRLCEKKIKVSTYLFICWFGYIIVIGT